MRLLTDVLRDLRGGACVDEATDRLAELVQRVTDTGKPGSITITLTAKVASRASGALIITDKVALKLPAGAPSESILFATPEGSLLTEDPRQQKLDLKAVPEPTKELRVASGTKE